jgi:hypothetical protein
LAPYDSPNTNGVDPGKSVHLIFCISANNYTFILILMISEDKHLTPSISRPTQEGRIHPNITVSDVMLDGLRIASDVGSH